MSQLNITNEQAYVLGILTGGGTIANGTFVIVLPFDKWGSDPVNASAISRDLLTKIRKLFSDSYKIDIDYSIGNKGRWSLKPIGNHHIQNILNDLDALFLPTSGILLDSANLIGAKSLLTGMRAENFLAGIFDARASLTESHRRFNSAAPVVSIEIPGSTMNFSFVVQMCAWLTDLGSVTDQIEFNHPCQQAASDPTYAGWKKGFKVRFLAKSFISTHSFAMRAKATEVTSLANTQSAHEQIPCSERKSSANTISIHDDIGCASLPDEVRNKLFLHYHHICAAMSCPYAPISSVMSMVNDAKNHISVFPKLSKGEFAEMEQKHLDLASQFFPSSELIKLRVTCHEILLSYSKSDYPSIEVALAYLLSDTLNGKRSIGPKDAILNANGGVYLKLKSIDSVDRAPLFIGIKSTNRGVLLSSPLGQSNMDALALKVTISGININVR